MDAQFEHLCRICAANTKSKNNSAVESVFIFKTTGLKEKIARHLFLNVAEDDSLPKVLCKSCYRQVEATASLSNIAKHTQRVFRDFLLSTVPKHLRQPTEEPVTESSTTSVTIQDISESQSSNNNIRNTSSLDNDGFQPILLARQPENSTALKPHQLTGNQNSGGVTINLTNKETEGQKLLSQHNESSTICSGLTNNQTNFKSNNLMLPTRRNSVFIDTRYSSAPMSIAQRSMQLPPSLAPIHSEISLSKATKNSPEKRNSPAGVINFIQTHGRVTGSAPIIATGSTSEGYSSSSVHAGKNPASASLTVSNAGVPNLPNSVLQQKRRNLKNALNNISAIRDGQVSLLKSAHQRQTSNEIDIRPLVTTTVVPHQSLYGSEPSVEEALPEHIIIAAPKKKKEDLGPAKLQKMSTLNRVPHEIRQTGEVLPSSKSKSYSSMSSLTEAISLGNVIRDPDLLKLILKALKWPITSENCEDQMTRLKNSKFAVIMSDSNLLQDTDLTQLLGPYLGPMMAIVQQNNKNLSHNKTPSPQTSPSQFSTDVQTIGDCTMPYKLPPETSVQLVPSSPTDQTDHEPSKQAPKSADPIIKRVQQKSRARDFIRSEQLSSIDTPNTSNAAVVTNELLNINAMLISQFGTNPADALNEALASMLKQQKESKCHRSTRRRRSASATSVSLNLEDIVLVEPQPALVGHSTLSNETCTITMPAQESFDPPVVTRPIIKRRKGVVQTSRQACTKSYNREQTLNSKTDDNVSKEVSQQCNVTEEIASTTTYPEQTENLTQKRVVEQALPTSTVPEVIPTSSNKTMIGGATDNTSISSIAKNTPNKQSSECIRKTTAKSALGQKLLEAIGLPQPGKDMPLESSRDSLRSALKRSLKHAQEQQQQLKRVKQEEPVKQIADSTTKLVSGESSDEHKKAIAERELELLKRKTKNSESKNNLSIKDEKLDRTDVSSSSSRNRRSNKISKPESHDDDFSVKEGKSERWDEDDDLPLKADLEKNIENVNRPIRTSKTMSKYYKCPGNEKTSSTQKSQRSMGRRSTRQR